ncbi:MAG: sigma-70 family RNA polymerase sigma factor [Sediminibacterium sp.]|nr:sigma-70 family RNA polymerase sigma factor [Sediminibacterium sp.]
MIVNALSEYDCVRLLNSGDPRAVGYLMDHCFRALCLFSEKITGDAISAQDIAEESIIKLWENRGGFTSFPAVKKFLYLCARNACFSELKLGGRREKRHDEYTRRQEPAEGFVLNEIIRAEVMDEIYTAIEQLPEKMGLVFKLAFLEGLSNGEIAAHLTLSVHTVKNQKSRALELLRLQFRGREHLLSMLLMLVALSSPEKNIMVH